MKSKVYWALGLLFAASVVLSACAAPGAPAAPAYLAADPVMRARAQEI